MIEQWAKAIQRHEGYYAPGSQYPNGSRSYRNNNPGNLRYTTYTASLGKNRGKDSANFIIYVDYETGFKALKQFLIDAASNVLRAYRGDMSLLGFYQVYAPSADSNNPANYAQAVASDLGVAVSVAIKTLLDPVAAPAPTPTPNTPGTIPKGQLVSLRQGDKRWGSVIIGQSNTDIAHDGCTITAITDYLRWLGFDYTPDMLARILRFTPKGAIYWPSITEKLPIKFVYRYWVPNQTAQDAALADDTQGLLLEVAYAGAKHWLFATGKFPLRYKAADPLRGDFCTTLLRYGKITGATILDKK